MRDRAPRPSRSLREFGVPTLALAHSMGITCDWAMRMMKNPRYKGRLHDAARVLQDRAQRDRLVPPSTEAEWFDVARDILRARRVVEETQT